MATETKTCIQLFKPNSPLELCLKTLARVNAQMCDADLRRFLFELQTAINNEASRSLKKCGVAYDAWVAMLIKTYNLAGTQACLTYENASPFITQEKRIFRDQLQQAWNALNFEGVNEGFTKWELQVVQDEAVHRMVLKSHALTQMIQAAANAHDCGMSQADIRKRFKEVMQLTGESKDRIEELLDVIIPN